jgi:hypothetical protein
MVATISLALNLLPDDLRRPRAELDRIDPPQNQLRVRLADGKGVPDFPGDGKILYYFGLPGWMSGFFQETAMDRLLTMDKQEYVSRMQLECRRIMEEIADAVNTAPTGNVISGAEMQVRDLMGELRRKAFETAVQMRIDSTESNFSPCEGSVRQTQGKKGARVP